MNGISESIAGRDWDGARNAGKAEAMDIIFGGGHGYRRGERLTAEDREACRDIAAEALDDYCMGADGELAAGAEVERLAAEIINAAQAKIDNLED